MKGAKGEKGRVVASFDTIRGGTDDNFGHDTHVAGIVAGDSASPCSGCVQFRGIAAGVSLINFTPLDQNGRGTDASVISEIHHCPGNDPYVITVGAMNTMGTPDRGDDIMTTYSSKGPTMIDHIAKPDLVAPGNRVVSLLANPKATLVQQFPANRPAVGAYEQSASPKDASKPSDNYFILSGTSMATPVVSAAAAILLQQNPSLTPDQVKARLMRTAYKNLPAFEWGGRTSRIKQATGTFGPLQEKADIVASRPWEVRSPVRFTARILVKIREYFAEFAAALLAGPVRRASPKPIANS